MRLNSAYPHRIATAASCQPLDLFVNEPFRNPYAESDPGAGAATVIEFSVKVAVVHRIIVKQGGQVVARFYGDVHASPRRVSFTAPGGGDVLRVFALQWTRMGGRSCSMHGAKVCRK